MNVRFKMINEGEIAILPLKEFEALVTKAQEADGDVGSGSNLIARALDAIDPPQASANAPDRENSLT